MSDIPAWIGGRLVPVEKLEVHRRGLRHRAVSVFAVEGDRVLLQRRAEGKYHSGGLWANTCCTHPDWGETAEACAHRRLDEELGLRDAELEHRGKVEYRAEVGNGLIEHELVDVFLARFGARVSHRPNPAEVSDTRWISLDDLRTETCTEPDRFAPWLRIYLATHADRIFGEDGPFPAEGAAIRRTRSSGGPGPRPG